MYAFLADTHIGTKLDFKDYLKSLDKFLSLIKKHKEECHTIFVCGDLFDHKLSVEDSLKASIFLMNLCMNNCGRNNKQHVPVRFVHGTYSHDYEQYKIFMPLLEKLPNVDVMYIDETCVGKTHNGDKVLYLPQIYGNFDYSPYISESHKYDIIVGHGPISSSTKSPCQSTQYEIMHSVELLGKISKICVFGHYHGYTDFGNNVYYAGPWLRWQYGEDEPRVFFFCDDNFKVQTFPNEFALEYKTIEISSPEQLRDIISTEITTPHRFRIHMSKEDMETYHSIMNINKKNTNLKYQIISPESDNNDNGSEPNDVINQNIDVDTQTSNSIDDPIESLISYVSDKYNIDVSKEIREYSDKLSGEDFEKE